MKRMIVIILVLFLFAGGGVGGLIMMGIIPNPFNPDANADAADAAPKRNVPTVALTLLKIEDMIVPVIIDGNVRRRIYISVRLDVAPDRQALVKARISEFQHAMINDLVPYFQKYFVDHNLIDVEILKQKLNGHADRLFGEAVNEVLLLNVFEQGVGLVR